MQHGPRPDHPRIEPLALADQDAETQSLLARIRLPGSPPATNIFATLARHRSLFRKWLSASSRLMSGFLPPRTRELAILRTAWRCGSEYEWGQHWLIGRHIGLSDDEMQRVQQGAAATGWSSADAAVLRAVDELHDDNCIGDATWATLEATFDERQLIELVMLVGQYHQVAYALNSLGVEREEGVPGFDG
jgi:4-carboxymuconolactone decarboxylase